MSYFSLAPAASAAIFWEVPAFTSVGGLLNWVARTGGAWTRGASTGFLMGETAISPNSIGNAGAIPYLQVFESGVWAVRILGSHDTSRGIITVKLNTATVGTHDQYEVGSNDTWNRWSAEITLGSLTAGTAYDLEFVAATKNALSTGYQQSIQKLLFYRTAA